METIDLFDEDGGTGQASGSIINCYFKEPVVSFIPICTITHGSKLSKTPISITITGITSQISSNTKVVLVIDGLSNPDVHNDNKHLRPSL